MKMLDNASFSEISDSDPIFHLNHPPSCIQIVEGKFCVKGGYFSHGINNQAKLRIFNIYQKWDIKSQERDVFKSQIIYIIKI